MGPGWISTPFKKTFKKNYVDHLKSWNNYKKKWLYQIKEFPFEITEWIAEIQTEFDSQIRLIRFVLIFSWLFPVLNTCLPAGSGLTKLSCRPGHKLFRWFIIEKYFKDPPPRQKHPKTSTKPHPFHQSYKAVVLVIINP